MNRTSNAVDHVATSRARPENRKLTQENRQRRRAGDGESAEDQRGARERATADQSAHSRDFARRTASRAAPAAKKQNDFVTEWLTIC